MSADRKIMTCDAVNPFNPAHRCTLGLGHPVEIAHTDGDATWLAEHISSDVERDDGDREDLITRRLVSAEKGGYERGWNAHRDEYRAEVVALTAERDRLREEVDAAQEQAAELLDDALDHGGRSDLKAAEAERDRLREERDKALRAHAAALIESRIWERRNERAEAERDTLAAQLARAETVIEAADRLCSHGPAGILAALDPAVSVAWAHERDERWASLRAAVDAYQATPSTTEREGVGDE